MESLITRPEFAQREYLQQRYQVRDAYLRGALPTGAQLSAADWSGSAASQEDFQLLYDVSILVVRRVVEVLGEEGLRTLVQDRGASIQLDDYIAQNLLPSLLTFLPEEVAGRTVCELSDLLEERENVIADWNTQSEMTDEEYLNFKARIQNMLEAVERLPAGTLVEEARLKYQQSFADWMRAIDYYLQDDITLGNSYLDTSNARAQEGYSVLSDSWGKYVVVSCEMIKEQVG